MKRSVIVFMSFLLVISLVSAQEVSVSEKGYDCLEAKVTGKCSSLSTTDKIFSLLAIDECAAELLEESSGEECWPSVCKVKETSQAAFALKNSGKNIDKITAWLESQAIAPPNIDWLLQIDVSSAASCTVEYKGDSHTIQIDDDRTINTNAGPCLRRYDGDYWLEVTETCYEEAFEITCGESFSTSLLYKDQDSETVYISGKKHDASASGTTTEKVESFCFKKGTACDYEGSLWAALALKTAGKNISSYLPYLITETENNQKFLPEAFLSVLAGEAYQAELLEKQKENSYWLASSDKFYDTALALYPFQYETMLQEKTNAIAWLEETQAADGCWQGITDTGFLLYSLWPTKVPASGDCKSKGYTCISSEDCAKYKGEELDYDCSDTNVCCSEKELLEKCSVQGGVLCPSGKMCEGEELDASDSSSSKICCDGKCVPKLEKSQCELQNGTCKTSCLDSEQEKDYDCPDGDVCCFEQEEKSYGLLIFFSVLIVLAIVGIIFRKKLRIFWFRFKSRFGKGGLHQQLSQGPRTPPSGAVPYRQTPRHIIPSQHKPSYSHPMAHHPSPSRQTTSEIDNVLKKLKEIGK